ncbi:MAG: hypothetical protein H7831_09955 [Magnetococcus sp. WYHC-3]
MKAKEFVIWWLHAELIKMKAKFLDGFNPLSDKDEEYRMAVKNLLTILEKEER